MSDRERNWLTAAEAAARLGVKRATLYAYVSRGHLHRRLGDDGRSSLFDPIEIDELRTRRRPETDGELRTLIATAITRVDDQRLLIRGQDLVGLVSDGATFCDVADILWSAPVDEPWMAVDTASSTLPSPASLLGGSSRRSLLDELRIVVAAASATDPLRHDLSPRSVRNAGRRLIMAQATGLGPPSGPAAVSGPGPEPAARLWRRLSARPPDDASVSALDAALSLLSDHGLAASTFAARIAASVRADPYAVVSAGLGVLGGPLHGAASGAVHNLLHDIEQSGDAVAAAGAARRRLGVFPGFGHQVYRSQDPRYGALMARIIRAWGDDPRLVNVYRMRDVIAGRTDAVANVDLAVGAMTYLADMPEDAGETVFAIARTAGWLAHAMEEYNEKALRFRPRARYIGPTAPEDHLDDPE